jgi:hypothetical protein
MRYRKVYIIIVAILLLTRVGYQFAHPDIYSDNIFQMAIAQNFMDGHGFSFKYINAQSEIYYSTDIKYPPLYPFILAVISFITGNPLLSSIIIQTFVLFLLVFFWRRIFFLFEPFINVEAYFYFISLIIMSTSIFNVINTILFVSLLLMSISIYCLFRYLLITESKKVNLILSSLFASLLFWTHYSNFFVAFYPAIVLFIVFYLSKKKTYLYDSLISILISIMITSGVLIYNYLLTGFINYYVDNPEVWKTGFFPEHLLLIDPLFLNAFVKSSSLPIHILFNISGLVDNLFFQIISLFVLLFIAFLIVKLFKENKSKFNIIFQIFITFLVIIILTISFLLYFSLRYKEIPSPGWTHIGDMRYMSAVYMSIIAAFIFLTFIKVKYISDRIIKVLRILIAVIILLSFSINVHSIITKWDFYDYKTNNYNHKNDLQDLFYNIKNELTQGNTAVFINNQLIEDAFRMSQLAGAAAINDSQIKSIEQFPPKIIYFFILPETAHYRKQDYQLIEWAKKFELVEISKVRNNISLFRVSN